MLQKSLAALALCFGLIACATPESVPSNARSEFNWLGAGPSDAMIYRWRRSNEQGCANLSATDGQLSVRLVVEPAKCRGAIRTDPNCDSCGPGLLYLGDSYIVIQNFWPWTGDDMINGIIVDANGVAQGFRPCPHSLTPEQLASMRSVAQGAALQATTNPERRTLQRIDQILAASNGATLRSGQWGCMLPEPASHPPAA